MHIHGVSSTQYAASLPTQSAQQALAARKAAAEVRRKLSDFAPAGGEDAVARVAAYAQDERGHRQDQPQEDEDFRSVFVSLSV